jgi:hypothetical protein
LTGRYGVGAAELKLSALVLGVPTGKPPFEREVNLLRALAVVIFKGMRVSGFGLKSWVKLGPCSDIEVSVAFAYE